VQATCDGYASAYNYTYIVPILNNTVISNNPYLSTCHHMYDDFYWSELYYNTSLTIDTAGKNLQNWDELRFYRDKIIPLVILLGEGVIVGQIADMNYTQNLHYNNLYNLMVSVNSSINQNINSINATLYSLISATNLSLSNKIDEINVTISAVNQSIWGKLFTIQGELQDINNNLTLIYNLIGMVNTTIMNKLFMVQDEITSLNNTIKDVNASIHSGLADLNNTIINGLLNVSNLTINITTSQDEIMGAMIAFGGDTAMKKNYAYLGMLPLVGLGEENALWSCKDNVTLVKYATKYIAGSLNKSYVMADEQICTYGCVKNACVLPAYQIWIYVFIGLIAVFILYLYFSRSAETGEMGIF
jgi:hypothetical protein